MPGTVVPIPLTNRLLDRLGAKVRAQLLSGCELHPLQRGDVLSEPDDAVAHVYFPTESFISLLVPMGRHGAFEVALVGNEGFHGIPVALGPGVTSLRSVVQGGGGAWRMSSPHFRRDLARMPTLRRCVDQYIFVLMGQFARTAGCSRHHVVEQRLARWLLTTADRAHTLTFPITHELLASMLGARRAGITQAAISLQAQGLIAYTRGVLTIRDRKGLQRASCACYAQDKARLEGVFN